MLRICKNKFFKARYSNYLFSDYFTCKYNSDFQGFQFFYPFFRKFRKNKFAFCVGNLKCFFTVGYERIFTALFRRNLTEVIGICVFNQNSPCLINPIMGFFAHHVFRIRPEKNDLTSWEFQNQLGFERVYLHFSGKSRWYLRAWNQTDAKPRG